MTESTITNAVYGTTPSNYPVLARYSLGFGIGETFNIASRIDSVSTTTMSTPLSGNSAVCLQNSDYNSGSDRTTVYFTALPTSDVIDSLTVNQPSVSTFAVVATNGAPSAGAFSCDIAGDHTAVFTISSAFDYSFKRYEIHLDKETCPTGLGGSGVVFAYSGTFTIGVSSYPGTVTCDGGSATILIDDYQGGMPRDAIVVGASIVIPNMALGATSTAVFEVYGFCNTDTFAETSATGTKSVNVLAIYKMFNFPSVYFDVPSGKTWIETGDSDTYLTTATIIEVLISGHATFTSYNIGSFDGSKIYLSATYGDISGSIGASLIRVIDGRYAAGNFDVLYVDKVANNVFVINNTIDRRPTPLLHDYQAILAYKMSSEITVAATFGNSPPTLTSNAGTYAVASSTTNSFFIVPEGGNLTYAELEVGDNVTFEGEGVPAEITGEVTVQPEAGFIDIADNVAVKSGGHLILNVTHLDQVRLPAGKDITVEAGGQITLNGKTILIDDGTIYKYRSVPLGSF